MTPGRRWSIARAWEAAVTVTAAAYDVAPAAIRAPSRGRGPRPQSVAWEPRKMAVHLAVVLTGCSYAAVGREIGLHRDTVASHCAEMRDQVLAEAWAETASETLEKLARARLEGLALERLNAARAHLAMLEEAAADLVSGAPQTASSDRFPTTRPTVLRAHAVDHGKVIVVETRGKAPA
ncbi:MAG: hypothetical protein ACREEW_06250 [Caulobacteraceae bacterium]